MDFIEPERLLTTQEASPFVGKSVPTMEIDRHKGRGCPYLKVGNKVFYRFSDIQAYLESCRVVPDGK